MMAVPFPELLTVMAAGSQFLAAFLHHLPDRVPITISRNETKDFSSFWENTRKSDNLEWEMTNGSHGKAY